MLITTDFQRISFLLGVLAIDDILVSPGSCKPSPGERRCDFELPGTCLFESVYTSVNIPKWKVYSAQSEGIPDHTTHSLDGHYYGLDLASFGKQRVSRLRSQVQSLNLNGSAMHCLRFSYLLANVLSNTSLYTFFDTTLGHGFSQHYNIELNWSVAGSTTGHWFSYTTPLPADQTFDLRLAIDTLGEPTGKVFVDDIHFSSESCERPQNCNFEVGCCVL